MAKNRDLSKFPNAITVLDNGNVGIGTTSPSYKLDITGNARLNNSSSMALQVNGGTLTQGTASTYSLGIGNGGGYDLTLGTSSTAAIIQSWSSKPISLNPQGNNVGIGTTSPFNRLTVQASGSYGLLTIGDSWASDTWTGIKIGAASDNGGAGVDIRSYSYYSASSGTTMTFHTNSSSNVLTERMRINQNGDIRIGDPSGADGRVMIKTHSPVAYSASGYNGTNANIRLMTAGNPPAGSTTGISFGISGASEAYIGAVQNSSSLAEIVFQTYNGSSYGERARINSNGYFTKPNQPFFQAFSGGGSWTSGQTVVWSNTLNNVGNGYNTSTGRFTAPVAGVYIFRADFRAPNNSTTNILDIKSSTGGLTRYEVPSGGNWYHTTVAAIYKLNAGDYVYCEAAAGTLQPDGNSIDRFEGYLLG